MIKCQVPKVPIFFVGKEGLEPSSLAALVPKTNAYTNSAIRAF